MAKPRRIGAQTSATCGAILDATEQTMIDEGYAAVSTRRIAGVVGLTPALVHYYFPTTDDLLVAVYRRAAQAVHEQFAAELASDKPLHALWTLSSDARRTRLGVEFMALANHRAAIRAEIALYAGRLRDLQRDALAKLIDADALDPRICSIDALPVLVAAIARALVMEESVGIHVGHDDTRKFVAWWLAHLDAKRLAAPKANAAKPTKKRKKAD